MKYDKRVLKRLMVERGLDPTTLALQTGLARPTVSMISRGVTVPKADTLGRIAHALGVDVNIFYKAA